MTLEEYLAHAAEAARLGRLARTNDEREAYEKIAAVWRRLAGSDGKSGPGRRETPDDERPQEQTSFID